MLSPEEVQAMMDRMGTNTDALISKGYAKPKRKDAKVLFNTLQEDLSIIYNHCYTNQLLYPTWLDDLVTGASRMNTHSKKPLNRGSIMKVLGSLEEITAASIAWKLKVDQRTAREYFSCIRVIYPHLTKYVKEEIELIEKENGDFFS